MNKNEKQASADLELEKDKKERVKDFRIIALVGTILFIITGIIVFWQGNKIHQNNQQIHYQTKYNENAYKQAKKNIEKIKTDKDIPGFAKKYDCKLVGSWVVNQNINPQIIQKTKLGKYYDVADLDFGGSYTKAYGLQLPYSKTISLLTFNSDHQVMSTLFYRNGTFPQQHFELEERMMRALKVYESGTNNTQQVNNLLLKFYKSKQGESNREAFN